MKYTKGPWTLKDNGAEFEIPEIQVIFGRSHSSGKERDKEIRESEQGQNELANAQLMVASRLMYEALRELVELKRIKDAYGKIPDYLARQPNAWKAAEQALAKAERNSLKNSTF